MSRTVPVICPVAVWAADVDAAPRSAATRAPAKLRCEVLLITERPFGLNGSTGLPAGSRDDACACFLLTLRSLFRGVYSGSAEKS